VKDRRGQIIGRVSIDERPKAVEQKPRMGDWEGGAIESAGKMTYIAAFADRKTKFFRRKLCRTRRPARSIRRLSARSAECRLKRADGG
jgi:IS30 family transposase